MHKISINDSIFATVINHGVTLFNSQFSGATSFEEIVKLICQRLHGVATGMVTLVLSNCTQGWRESHMLRLGKPLQLS